MLKTENGKVCEMTQEEVAALEVADAARAQTMIALAATQYQRDRAVAYPSFGEQMDMQYWDAVNGTTTWQDAITAVKAKYPKP